MIVKTQHNFKKNMSQKYEDKLKYVSDKIHKLNCSRIQNNSYNNDHYFIDQIVKLQKELDDFLNISREKFIPRRLSNGWE